MNEKGFQRLFAAVKDVFGRGMEVELPQLELFAGKGQHGTGRVIDLQRMAGIDHVEAVLFQAMSRAGMRGLTDMLPLRPGAPDSISTGDCCSPIWQATLAARLPHGLLITPFGCLSTCTVRHNHGHGSRAPHPPGQNGQRTTEAASTHVS